MDDLFAHDPIKCAILAHVMYDADVRAQSVTSLAPLRLVARAWNRAIPAPPKYCAYVFGPQGSRNPAACGDIPAMRAMFGDSSGARWLRALRESYDEQSAWMRARYANCGFEPARITNIIHEICSLDARIYWVNRTCWPELPEIPMREEHSGNELVRRLRAGDCVIDIKKEMSQERFSRELREVYGSRGNAWTISIETRARLMRDYCPVTDNEYILRICLPDFPVKRDSILRDPGLIDYYLSNHAKCGLSDQSHALNLALLCVFHLESRASVARVIARLRELNQLHRNIAQFARNSAVDSAYGSMRNIKMLFDAADCLPDTK